MRRVISKNNKHFDHSLDTARQLTGALEVATIKNEGVFQAESEYVQDNAVPAMFVSIETKNDETSNSSIVNTLADFIQKVDDQNTTEASIDAPNDSITVEPSVENKEIKVE